MNDAKIKAFIAHILDECAQEGFTMEDALKLPQELKFALNERAMKIWGLVHLSDFLTAP